MHRRLLPDVSGCFFSPIALTEVIGVFEGACLSLAKHHFFQTLGFATLKKLNTEMRISRTNVGKHRKKSIGLLISFSEDTLQCSIDRCLYQNKSLFFKRNVRKHGFFTILFALKEIISPTDCYFLKTN